MNNRKRNTNELISSIRQDGVLVMKKRCADSKIEIWKAFGHTYQIETRYFGRKSSIIQID